MGLSRLFGKLSSLPEEYGIAAGAAAGGTQMLAGAADMMQNLHEIDLSNARQKVQDALTRAGRPVVIFVDDVDRLGPKEIRLLFQFLKAVVDFRGASYLLAYDPAPVEKALSFGGELNGREYLKKFIQLPIRLPRISNLLLQRFFREAVCELSNSLKPPLTKDEISALSECSQLAVFLLGLKTPRDVVRLLNSFRLRLSDCRDEVNLDQLLLFVLLDLVSPESVELVRMHPELFLLPLATHPEFEVLEADGNISRLMSDEKDKTQAKEHLFADLDEEERPLAKKLVSQMFETGKRREESYDVRQAQTAHGLIKLLYGGTSSLSFSVKDAVSFLQGRRRTEIVDEIRNSGSLKQWIYFLSGITSSTDVKNVRGIAEMLISAAREETPTTWVDSIHRVIGEYLVEVFGKLSVEKERLRLLKTVASQQKNLFIAEHFLVKVASDAGLWKNGQSFSLLNRQPHSEPDRVTPEAILAAEDCWLKNVRAAAAKGTLHKHPHLASILHRWGQFNSNNYTEVQNYFEEFARTRDPLLILEHFPLGVSLDGLDKIIRKPQEAGNALSRYTRDPELREVARKVMDGLGKRNEQNPAPD
jgi:hypothetical protein